MFKRKLILKKTHDKTPSGKPEVTLLCLHGIATDAIHTYGRIWPYLEGTQSMKNVRFVGLDWLGHGKSSKSKKLEYTYEEQMEALENSIKKYKIEGPIIVMCHSLGTLLTSRYAETHKKAFSRILMVSPVPYSRDEIKFLEGQGNNTGFIQRMGKKWLKNKAFMNSIHNVSYDIKNNKTFENLTTKTTMLIGTEDEMLSIKNLRYLAKANPKHLTLIEMKGHHGVSRTKYTKILEILEGFISEII